MVVHVSSRMVAGILLCVSKMVFYQFSDFDWELLWSERLDCAVYAIGFWILDFLL